MDGISDDHTGPGGKAPALSRVAGKDRRCFAEDADGYLETIPNNPNLAPRSWPGEPMGEEG